MCLVALPVGALVAPLPFGPRVRRYALLALPLGVVAAVLAWNGHVGRVQGAVLLVLYVAYVGVIWWRERRPPALGEVAELDETKPATPTRRIGRELALVLVGVATLAIGSIVLVEAIRSISGVESTQTNLSLTLVGFATTLELVLLAWSTARRSVTEAVVAAVVGSFAYNATMSLGAAALVRPLAIADAELLARAARRDARGARRRRGGRGAARSARARRRRATRGLSRVRRLRPRSLTVTRSRGCGARPRWQGARTSRWLRSRAR